jgi:hypothetical protein
MEELVVYSGIDLEGTESRITGRCYEEEKGSCVMSVGAMERRRGCGKSEPAKGSLIRILRDVL